MQRMASEMDLATNCLMGLADAAMQRMAAMGLASTRNVRARTGLALISQPKINLNRQYAFCVRARANDTAPLVLGWQCAGCGAYWQFYLVAQQQVSQMEFDDQPPVLEVAIHQGRQLTEDRQLGECMICEVAWVPYIG